MQPIPNTGPGIWGFFAHLLWQIYAWFPSAGQYDWALLMLLMGIAMFAIYLPWLWRFTASDMLLLRDGTVGDDTAAMSSMVTALPAIATLFVLLWFFGTSAGKTFLNGRGAWWMSAPTDVSGSCYFLCLGFTIAAIVVTATFSEKVDVRNKGMGGMRSRPYADRSLLSLFGGGGVFLVNTKGATVLEQHTCVLLFALVAILMSLVFYWYWSVASLTLMFAFLLGATAAEACRMLFVSIHHKRTFG